jgi:hypothetical protein
VFDVIKLKLKLKLPSPKKSSETLNIMKKNSKYSEIITDDEHAE